MEIVKHRSEVVWWDLDGIPIDRYQDMDGSSRSIRMRFYKTYVQYVIPGDGRCIEDAVDTFVISGENALTDPDITDCRVNDVMCWRIGGCK